MTAIIALIWLYLAGIFMLWAVPLQKERWELLIWPIIPIIAVGAIIYEIATNKLEIDT